MKTLKNTIITIFIILTVLLFWREYVIMGHREKPEKYTDVDKMFGIKKDGSDLTISDIADKTWDLLKEGLLRVKE